MRNRTGWRRSPGARSLACAVFLTVALGPGLAAQDAPDPARGLKSKNISERLAAIEALRNATDPQHEKLLLGVLGDRDWEVIEKAAAALADRGSDLSVVPLVKLCTEGPILRIRRAASRSLAKAAPEKGTAELLKHCSGKSSIRAFEALAIVAPRSGDESAAATIQRGIKSKDAPLRRAAALGIASLPDAAADETLATILQGKESELAAIVLGAVERSAEPHFLPALFKAIHEPHVPDVLERRLISAAAACMATLEKNPGAVTSEKQLKSFAELGPLSDAEAEARAVRLDAALYASSTKESALNSALATLLQAGLANSKPPVRKAALAGALRHGVPTAKETALAMAAKDPDAGVRLFAIRELTRVFAATDSALAPLLTERVTNDSDTSVRAEAAVALGLPDIPGSATALASATKDPNWIVATCAAVSLGKTRDPAGLEALQAMQSQGDWRYRASAVVGLCRMFNKDAIPDVIRALADTDPCVKRTAYVFLEQQLKAHLPEERAAWEAWWKDHGPRFQLVDPVQERKRREQYGYASTEAVYADLDVVVLDSRGDHIQRLLTQLKIAHRLTSASKVEEAALHPWAVYISNCTGEIETKDVERLAWYVRAGGVLFGSCWSLTETIERVHPGVLKHLETSAEVVDDVVALPVDPNSPYLKSVFQPDVEPLYNLEGSHLIEVIEPELCEVLIDSPQCLEKWGGGNLAAAFHSGHGLILDSANHFDLQGLEVAPGLKTSADRIAFAFDRMSLDYDTWRRTQNEKWWDSALKASQNVFDWSALNFVTNFVREKRLADS
ncbi:MAG TPA: HEAT repeat domain-containing protein [Planctomycetota bacterium]|nr:HEAT repeat domain-containing protein [Planctomycetota bacterium]